MNSSQHASDHIIRVMAFDDHEDLREMIRILVDSEPDMTCVSVHPDLSQVLRDVKAGAPDVIVMDIQMPGMNGIDGVRTIKRKYPNTRILMQTVFEDKDHVFDAICAGASGYILKNSSPEIILSAIRDTHAGGAPMTPMIAAKVLAKFRGEDVDSSAEKEVVLSKREKQVLEKLVDGLSYKMIANDLDISYHTVDSHIRKIYDKLHVSSMAEAVAKTLRTNLLD